MVNRLIALTKTVDLPVEVDETEATSKTGFVAILQDMAPDVVPELESAEFSIRVEDYEDNGRSGRQAIAYRTGAVFG